MLNCRFLIDRVLFLLNGLHSKKIKMKELFSYSTLRSVQVESRHALILSASSFFSARMGTGRR